MSTPAIDTARTSERLSFFLSKIIEKEPIDQIFTEYPILDHFWESKEVDSYGRQVRINLDTALAPNFQWFSSGSTFTTTLPNVVRTAVFPMVNAGITVNIDWEEMMEASTSDVRCYDIAAQRKKSAQNTIRDNLNRTILATGNASDRIIGIPDLVDATSTIGGLNRSTETYWQAQVTSSIGAFTSNGLTNMRSGYNLVTQTGAGSPTIGITTRAIHEAFEAEVDPDVRYSDSKKLSRGALQLFWKGFPLHFDQDMTTGEMYFLNNKNMKMLVESKANMVVDPFREPVNQKQMTGKILLRCAMIVTSPRGLWKGTGIT